MTSQAPNELLLLVFLHGFKGGDDTFAAFPERLKHNLEQAEPRCKVEPHIYPRYDTRGELTVAVDNHVSWLTELLATQREEYTKSGGTGPARAILLGHSMGGLVISDATLATLGHLPILGVICYDSPLLGLNPAVFRNTLDKIMNYVGQAQAVAAAAGVGYGWLNNNTKKGEASKGKTTPPKTSAKANDKAVSKTSDETATANKSSFFSLANMAIVGAVTAVAGGAGAAYYNREAIGNHWLWATSHLSFVGELWKTTEMEQRIQKIVEAQEKGIGFHCYYTRLPAKEKEQKDRTFCVLPNTPAVRAKFSPNNNNQADDEVTAHIEMFTEKSDGLYSLAQETCALIGDWIGQAREGKMGAGKGEKVAGAGDESVDSPSGEKPAKEEHEI